MKIKVGNITITDEPLVRTYNIGALPPRVDGEGHTKVEKLKHKLKKIIG